LRSRVSKHCEMERFVLDRMIKDDIKKMIALGDHALNAVEMYEFHHTRLARKCIRTGQWLLMAGQRLLERG